MKEQIKAKYLELQTEKEEEWPFFRGHDEKLNTKYAAKLLNYIKNLAAKGLSDERTPLKILMDSYNDYDEKSITRRVLARSYFKYILDCRDAYNAIPSMKQAGFTLKEIAYAGILKHTTGRRKHTFAAKFLEHIRRSPPEELLGEDTPLVFFMKTCNGEYSSYRKILAEYYFTHVLNKDTDISAMRKMREAGFTATEVSDAGITCALPCAGGGGLFAYNSIEVKDLIKGGYTAKELLENKYKLWEIKEGLKALGKNKQQIKDYLANVTTHHQVCIQM